MPHAIVGFLKEQGYDDGDISEMLTPMEQYDDIETSLLPENPHIQAELGTIGPPSTRHDRGGVFSSRYEDIYGVLTAAQSERQPPGAQAVVPPGPKGAKKRKRGDAKAVRVDTEASYRGLKRATAQGQGVDGSDAPQDAPSIEALAEREDRILMGSAPFYTAERSIAGDSSFYRRDDGAGQSTLLGADQTCVLCGRESPGTAICGACLAGAQAVGFGERGSAADIYGDGALDAGTAAQLELLGLDPLVYNPAVRAALMRRNPTAYIRPIERAELQGGPVDYIRPFERAELDLLGDVAALETPWPAYDAITLAYSQPDVASHATSWQSGPDIYSSLRLTGWDGEPRVLTATTKFDKAMASVVGYAQRAGVPPARLIGIAAPLARKLGASSLVPQIAAASPALLGIARHINMGPFIAVVGAKR